MTLNPWFSIWLKPRQTIRQIIDNDPGWMFWRLCLLTGAAGGVIRAEGRADRVIATMIVAAFSPLVVYCAGWVFRWVGSWFGGRATNCQVRAAVVWSSMPVLVTLVLWVPLVAVQTAASPLPSVFTLISLVIVVWRIVMLIQMLAEVHGFSAGKAVLTVGVPSLIGVLALVSTILIADILSKQRWAKENAAVEKLRYIAEVLATYHDAHGEYPEEQSPYILGQLVPSKMDVGKPQQFEYAYERQADRYAVTAIPQLVVSRAFFLDQTGQIRHCRASHLGERAHVADQVLIEKPAPCTL